MPSITITTCHPLAVYARHRHSLKVMVYWPSCLTCFTIYVYIARKPIAAKKIVWSCPELFRVLIMRFQDNIVNRFHLMNFPSTWSFRKKRNPIRIYATFGKYLSFIKSNRTVSYSEFHISLLCIVIHLLFKIIAKWFRFALNNIELGSSKFSSNSMNR